MGGSRGVGSREEREEETVFGKGWELSSDLESREQVIREKTRV